MYGRLGEKGGSADMGRLEKDGEAKIRPWAARSQSTEDSVSFV
jgi:hypothetical protein